MRSLFKNEFYLKIIMELLMDNWRFNIMVEDW